MFGEHLKEVRNLMTIKRYQNKYKHKTRSVAEHSWFVSKIAHGLALWERDKFNTEGVDVESVLFMAINHDIIETYTGDILSTTKRISPLFSKELLRVEDIIFNTHILKQLPKSWQSLYSISHVEIEERKSVNSKLVKASDLIDRVFECLEEIELSNKNPFESIIREDLVALHNLNLLSVNYFLKYSLADIDAKQYLDVSIKNKLMAEDFSKYF